jgi:hypothetical protein
MSFTRQCAGCLSHFMQQESELFDAEDKLSIQRMYVTPMRFSELELQFNRVFEFMHREKRSEYLIRMINCLLNKMLDGQFSV